MRITNILFILLLLSAVVACSDEQNNSEITSGSIETAVENAVSNLNAMMVEPNEEILNNLTADKLTYGHSGGTIQDKEEFIYDLINGPFSFKSIDLSEQTIDVSGDVAVVRHILDAEGSDSGTPVHVHIGIMMVFQNQSGQWKLLARQAYKL